MNNHYHFYRFSIKNLLTPLFILSSLFVAYAQTSTTSPVPSTKTTATQGIVLARVGLNEPKILFEDRNTLRIGFIAVNGGDESQTDIHYGVEIIKETDNSQTVVDSYVPNETISLSRAQSAKKEIVYSVSPFLTGKYQVWVFLKTTSGLILGLGRAGTVMLAGSPSYIEIIPESCATQVKGDTKLYSLYQGVDVAPTESLLLTCTFDNHSQSPIVFTPIFETYLRTTFGEKVDVQNSQQEEVALAPGEKRTLSFTVPKAAAPQAYDVVMSLVDKSSEAIISNKIIAHYVLRGRSASVQNVTLDKDNYAKGETLTANIFWTPSADSFTGSRAGSGTDVRATLQLSITNEKGVACINPISKVVNNKETNLLMQASIIADCSNPHTTFKLVDDAGKSLDSRIFISPVVKHPNTKARTNSNNIVVTFAVLVFLGGGVTYLLKRKFKNINAMPESNVPPRIILKSIIFLMLLASGIFGGTEKAEAGSVTFCSVYGCGDWTITGSTDKDVYSPSSIIYGSWSSQFNYCGNDPGSQYTITMVFQGDVNSYTHNLGVKSETLTPSVSNRQFTAPSAPGNYTVVFTGCVGTECTTQSIPITVVGPPPTVNIYFSFLNNAFPTFSNAMTHIPSILASLVDIIKGNTAFSDVLAEQK